MNKIAVFVLLLLCTISQAAYASTAPIGKIIALAGEAIAINDSVSRELKLASEVFPKDTITTTDSGKLQIMFNDDTLLSIAPATEISIDDYVYDENQSSFLVNCTTGMLEFATGDIVKKNPEGFKFETPLNVIGIRGTIGGLMVGAASGTTPPPCTAMLFHSSVPSNMSVTGKSTLATVPFSNFGQMIQQKNPQRIEPPQPIPADVMNTFRKGTTMPKSAYNAGTDKKKAEKKQDDKQQEQASDDDDAPKEEKPKGGDDDKKKEDGESPQSGKDAPAPKDDGDNSGLSGGDDAPAPAIADEGDDSQEPATIINTIVTQTLTDTSTDQVEVEGAEVVENAANTLPANIIEPEDGKRYVYAATVLSSNYDGPIGTIQTPQLYQSDSIATLKEIDENKEAVVTINGALSTPEINTITTNGGSIDVTGLTEKIGTDSGSARGSYLDWGYWYHSGGPIYEDTMNNVSVDIYKLYYVEGEINTDTSSISGTYQGETRCEYVTMSGTTPYTGGTFKASVSLENGIATVDDLDIKVGPTCNQLWIQDMKGTITQGQFQVEGGTVELYNVPTDAELTPSKIESATNHQIKGAMFKGDTMGGTFTADFTDLSIAGAYSGDKQ
jgi:hypothetical protein